MNRALVYLDLFIRISATIVIGTLGGTAALVSGIFAMASGKVPAIVTGLIIVAIGGLINLGLILLAVIPEKVERYIPGPAWLGMILVRLPTYPIGTGGMALLIRQVILVTIADLRL